MMFSVGVRAAIVGVAAVLCAASFAAPQKQATQTQYGCRHDSDCKHHGGVCESGSCREPAAQPAPAPQYEQPAASYEQPAGNYEPPAVADEPESQPSAPPSDQPSLSDQVNDQMGKYNETLKCQNRCQADSLTC